MYALAIIRFRKPLDQVMPVVDAHRAYLASLKEQGILLASGPLDPRNGGALLLRVPDDVVDATLDAVRDNDPYIKANVAQYELLPWNPVLGKEGLDQL
ncbi:MAG: YciI family protein [Formivibrio sp.]|nr:YciI family protein [Formivibrio sp.]